MATTRPPRDDREQNNPVVVVAVQSNPVEGCQEYFMSRQSRASALAEPAPAKWEIKPAETKASTESEQSTADIGRISKT